MTNQRVRVFGFLAFVAVATGCPQCAPDQVGPGVARLTVRNVGTMVSLVNADATCGFASPSVLGAGVQEGEVGSAGSLTFTVNNCVIDLGEAGRAFPADCNGTASTARGKVTISATRRIEGTLTGLAQTPIIPGNADAVTINITNATFENFEVRNLASENVLTMLNGSLSAVVKPRLAVSASSGACAIATPNVTFSDIVYTDANVHLQTPTNAFDVPVPTSDISAQNGVNGGSENAISGGITVFDSPVTLSGELDTEYDATRFQAGYACTPDLDQPVSYTCGDLRPRLSDGAARLSVKMMGTVTSLIDANTTCGFSAPSVLGDSDFAEGTEPGELDSVTFTVTGCELEFPDVTELSPDCNGVSTTVQGKVTVSGTKTISGRATGNPLSPIVPQTEQPARIALTIDVGTEGFEVGSTADGNSLRATAGRLVGTTEPRVFVGAATGVCSVSSPHAELHVQWNDADLLVSSASGTLGLDAVDTDLTAVNGSIATGSDPGTNELSGTVTVGQDTFTVPSDEAGLNPTFDLAAFDQGWQTCGAAQTGLASPANSQCAVAAFRTIAGGTASLTMRTLGTVVSLLESPAVSDCGFASGITPSVSGGGLGDDDVTATFTLPVDGCTITLPPDTALTPDCLGNRSTAGGTVVVTGTKKVTGFLTGSANPAEAIVPTSFKPAEYDLVATFTNFVVKSPTSTAFLTVHSGELAGKVNPRTAMDPVTKVCSKPTPNLTFSEVAWSDADVTLTSSGSNFRSAVATSALTAQNGNDLRPDMANTLSGSITIDGTPAPIPEGTPLDRAYDETAFNSTYLCEAAGSPLLVPDAACSFRQVLGNAAARLLAGSVATATSVSSNAPFSCYSPETINGAPGGPGTSVGTASSCNVQLASELVTGDCSGPGQDDTRAQGTVAVSGTKTTSGLVVDATQPPDGTADAVAPLTRTAVAFTDMSYAMTDWRFEKRVDGVAQGRLTLTGNVGMETFTPVLTQTDANNDDVADDAVFDERTPIFEEAGLTMASGRATLVLQGKTFGVDLTGVDLDILVGAFGGRANSISGVLTVDGEPVVIAPATPFDAAFTQAALDASYSCSPVILVPAN